MRRALRVETVLGLASLFLLPALLAAGKTPETSEGTAGDGQRLESAGNSHAGGLLPVNRDYYDVAAATGGEFYFWAPGEFSSVGEIAPIERETLLLDYGEIPQAGAGYRIAVDPTLARLTVFLGAQRLDGYELRRPDGTLVGAPAPGVRQRLYGHMALVTVEDPDPGEWHLGLKGEGLRCLTVRGSPAPGSRSSEAISLSRFEFVERAGVPGHEGLAPIEGAVEAGGAAGCLARLHGPVATARVVFLSVNGETLGRQDLEPGHPLAASGEFVGRCEIPRRAFRALVAGEDLEGRPYQRVHPPLIEPAGTDAPVTGGS